MIHFTPPSNWLNDPNGLVYYAGEYHLFYQHHPHSLNWGPMHWGHAVSRDLINWEHLPIALYPDENGMIFSGSAVVDWHNTAGFGMEALIAIYTCHKEHVETQNLAYSQDKGRTWMKYAGNPVIPQPDGVRDFRDPRVFWHQDHWAMALAAGDAVLFYVSPNLIDWTFSGSFGHGFGSTLGTWETPDLFELPITGSLEQRWVLTVGVGDGGPAGGSATQYFIGQFDGAAFTSQNLPETVLWADYGADYYAPQSWSEEPHGRRVMIGWLANWRYASLTPATSWRGMFSLPRELSLIQTENGLRLFQQPVAELKTLRGKTHRWQNRIIQPGENLLDSLTGQALEIITEFEMNPQVESLGFRLRQGNGEVTVIGYDARQQQLFVDRTHSGQSDFKDGFAAVHSVPLSTINGWLRLQIFVDSTSVEVFGNAGRVVLTESIFPSENSQGLDFFVVGGEIKITTMELYWLNNARFSQSANNLLEAV